jgi:hypothetical protein
MKYIIVFLLISYIGCQDYNSNTFDKAKFAETQLGGGPNFKASYAILQNRCMNCHRHSQWAGYTKPEDWVTNENLVIESGNPLDSQLINRLINNGGDMPVGGKALPTTEHQTLLDWVKNINS